MMQIPHYHPTHSKTFKKDSLRHKAYHTLLLSLHAIGFTVAGLTTILTYEWGIAPFVHFGTTTEHVTNALQTIQNLTLL